MGPALTICMTCKQIMSCESFNDHICSGKPVTLKDINNSLKEIIEKLDSILVVTGVKK